MNKSSSQTPTVGKWLSTKERKPLQQLKLAPLNFEEKYLPRTTKWKDVASTPTSAKQGTLDKFLSGSAMPRKSTKLKISVPKEDTKQDIRGASADTIETLSSTSSNKQGKEPEIETLPSHKKRREKSELTLSPTRSSPRILAQKSQLKAKPPPPLVRATQGTVRQKTSASETAMRLSSSAPPPSLSITTRQGQLQQRGSPSQPETTYYTAPTSPAPSSSEFPDKTTASVDVPGDKAVTETNLTMSFAEVPSSLPWENTPSDGYGDVWPSSQSNASPPGSQRLRGSQASRKSSSDDNVFRVPDLPSSRLHNDETQDESPSPHSSPNRDHRLPPRTLPITLSASFRAPLLPKLSQPGTDRASKQYPDETQDETQDLNVPEIPPSARKRKREESIVEVKDSQPNESDLSSDSLIMLSQPPPSMRKKSPEVIEIHSSQSQNQDFVAPLPPIRTPRPSSSDLSKPFGYTSPQIASQNSSHHASHNWESSQATASPVEPRSESSQLLKAPSILSLDSQAEITGPEPLGLTLEFGFPRRSVPMADLDALEKENELELQKWEQERKMKHK